MVNEFEEKMELDWSIDHLREQYEMTRLEFIKWDFTEDKATAPIKFAIDLWGYYRAFLLFHDGEVIKKFDDIGFSQRFRLRLLHYDQINQCLDEIEQQGLNCLKSFAHYFIYSFLLSKTLPDIVSWLGLSQKHDMDEEKSLIYKNFHDFFERKKYRNGEPARTNFDKTLDDLTGILAGMENSNVRARKHFLQHSEGKTEAYYLQLLLETFLWLSPDNRLFHYADLTRSAKMTQQKFLNILAPLFRILLVDYKFMEPTEYEKKQDAVYDSYERYLASRIKKLVFKK
ncbi:MAG: hypothetical protein BGO69_04835 [Bacteroidetes bacterium 46-16]|nr:MAG: hypothetical protein BGO69_04835 [Bacteroidetes bacterium 46-16]